MSGAQVEAESIQLRFDFHLAQGEDSIDYRSNTTGARWDKRSIENPAGGRPELDSGMD